MMTVVGSGALQSTLSYSVCSLGFRTVAMGLGVSVLLLIRLLIQLLTLLTDFCEPRHEHVTRSHFDTLTH
jgi:hypothetical protein